MCQVYFVHAAASYKQAQEFEGICELVEPLGNEYMIYVKANDQTLTARLDPKILPEINKTLKLSIDLSKGHFFDIKSEIRL